MSGLTEDQIIGAEFLASKNFAAIGDAAGTGKTAQAILACDLVGAEKILVICPAVARINWRREFEMWSICGGQDFQILEGKEDKPNSKKLVCSFEYATTYVESLKALGRFDVIIIDEFQNIKNPESQRTVAIYGKNGLVRCTRRMWLLSGDAAVNHYGELWPTIYTLGLTKLSYNAFIQKYCNVKVAWHGGVRTLQVMGSKEAMAQEIKDLLAPMMIRRLQEEMIMELPPITYETVYIKPCEVDLALYQSFIKYMYPKDERTELEKILASERARLLDAVETYGTGEKGIAILENMFDSVATLRKYTGLQKLEGIVHRVDRELRNNHYDKIVIFAVHVDVIDTLRREFSAKGFDVVTLYGATPPKKRQANIDRFQNNPKCRIFIGNIQACGVAITLTAACEVLFAEWTFVPGVNSQAVMRVHRRTQLRAVRVRYAAIQDSIDDKVSSAYMRKAKELTAVFGGRVAQITKITEAEELPSSSKTDETGDTE